MEVKTKPRNLKMNHENGMTREISVQLDGLSAAWQKKKKKKEKKMEGRSRELRNSTAAEAISSEIVNPSTVFAR